GHDLQAFGEILRRPRAGERREARDAAVDAVEERGLVLLHLSRERRLDELVRGLRRGSRQREQLARPLAFVHAPRFAANLAVRLAEQRIVDARVDARDSAGRFRLAGKPESGAVIELLRLPGPQAFPDLFGILRR